MRAPVTLDLHLPNFNYPDTAPEQLFAPPRRDRANSGGVGLQLDHGDGPPAPDPRRRAAHELDARGQHDPRRARRAHLAREPRAPGRRCDVPQSGAAGEAHDDAGRHLGRPRGAGARGGVERGGARRLRHPVPAAARALRAPGGRAADRARDVHAAGVERRGTASQHGERRQQPAAAARRHPDPGRRQRRAQDAAPRRAVRGRLQRVRRRRARAAPDGRARRSLRGRRPRPLRDHAHAHGRRVHRADPRAGAAQARRR